MCAGKKWLRKRERKIRRRKKREGSKSGRVASNQCLPLFNLWHVVLSSLSLVISAFCLFKHSRGNLFEQVRQRGKAKQREMTRICCLTKLNKRAECHVAVFSVYLALADSEAQQRVGLTWPSSELPLTAKQQPEARGARRKEGTSRICCSKQQAAGSAQCK